MNEEKETNIETQEPQIPEDALPEEIRITIENILKEADEGISEL